MLPTVGPMDLLLDEVYRIICGEGYLYPWVFNSVFILLNNHAGSECMAVYMQTPFNFYWNRTFLIQS